MADVRELSKRIREAMSAPLGDLARRDCEKSGMSECGYRDQRVIDLTTQLPMTESEITVCRMLGEPRSAFLAERNRRFEAAWQHGQATADGAEPASAVPVDIDVITQLVVMTNEITIAEALLAVISWQMADERLPKLKAINRELRAVITAQRKTN